MRPIRLITVLLLPALLALGACGGVSREDYAEDLNEICTDIEEQTERIGQVQAGSPQELSTQLGEIRSAIRDGIDRMKDLERPEGEDGERAEEYVNRLETALEEEVVPALDELEQAVREEDEERIAAAAQRLQAIDEEETQELARDLGADECAEG